MINHFYSALRTEPPVKAYSIERDGTLGEAIDWLERQGRRVLRHEVKVGCIEILTERPEGGFSIYEVDADGVISVKWSQ